MQPLAEYSGAEGESRINLRKLYPISHLWPVMRSASWLGMLLLSLFVVGITDYYWASEIENDIERDLVHLVMAILLIVSFFGWLLRFLMYELEMWHYDYRVEKGHLNINKGIFLKQKGSFPLSRITDIYLDRSFSDFIFGLWNVHVSTPTASSGVFARVNGLSELNAAALQRSLSELVQASSIDLDDLGNNVAQRNYESYRHMMQNRAANDSRGGNHGTEYKDETNPNRDHNASSGQSNTNQGTPANHGGPRSFIRDSEIA